MKLAILQGLLSEASGGLAASVPGMVRALSETTKLEPHVLGIAEFGAPEVIAKWGKLVHEHRAYGPAGFHWAPSMAGTLDVISPDVMDTQGVWMNLSRIALARHRRHATPYVVTPHGMLDPWAVGRSFRRKRLVCWWFENDHLASAAAIRALNADEARSVREFGVTSPIAIIPNGIDAPHAADLTVLADREPILQFLGRLDPKKGLEPLFEAWALAKKEPSARDWRLRVNGWGTSDYVERLHRRVAELNIKDTLILAGPVYGTEKEKTLGSSAGFILPSFSEGLPMAILEAWSWGTPVLMTRACNLPEGFATGAALEITTKPEDLCRRIIDYVKMSAEDRRAMAIAGRALVETKYNAQYVASDLERLYSALVEGKAVPTDLLFNG
jgi:glycosyltransferase involved in cell wall biosynthesis